MRQVIGLRRLIVVGIGLAFVATTSRSTPVPPDQLPEPVASTFRTMFPNGTIQKLDSEEENGVVVYDFEFRAGGREKETDIAADGTMIESTLVITAKDIPATAMKGIRAVAKGAKLGRCEWIETSYELEGGKVIKMAKPMIKYAAEMRKAGKMAEAIVTTDGKVVEAPEWLPIPPPPPAAGK